MAVMLGRKSLGSAGAVLAGGAVIAATFAFFEYGGERLTPKPQDNPRGFVSLTFDDGWESVYEEAIPVLTDAGFMSTHYITTSPWDNPNDPNYMTHKQVQELFAKGHEIGPHGISHQSLPNLSEERIRREIENSKSVLEEIGVFPSTFAYPYGEYNDMTTAAVKKSGFVGAATAWEDVNTRADDPYVLKRRPLRNTTSLEEVKRWVDQAITDDGWMILMFHQIDDSGREYAITPELFVEIVKYLQDTGVRVITVREGVETFLDD